MKTVSKQLAISLKEAGFPQESYFWWIQDNGNWHLETEKPEGIEWENFQIVACPTAEEILERLPWAADYKDTLYPIKIFKFDSGGYAVIYQDATKSIHGDTLAEAAGKMWLYLQKKGLLSDTKKKETVV